MAYWGGLAAVWAPALTRRDLFRSLCQRHTYAITRARIILKMTVNGALMGSEIEAAKAAQIKIDVWTPSRLDKIELIKNTRLLREFPASDDEFHLEFEDVTTGPAFYHCRVTQADGNLAVCSPVWIG